jgi:hypothetical protein
MSKYFALADGSIYEGNTLDELLDNLKGDYSDSELQECDANFQFFCGEPIGVKYKKVETLSITQTTVKAKAKPVTRK